MAVVFSRSLFDITFGQQICSILLRHLLSNSLTLISVQLLSFSTSLNRINLHDTAALTLLRSILIHTSSLLINFRSAHCFFALFNCAGFFCVFPTLPSPPPPSPTHSPAPTQRDQTVGSSQYLIGHCSLVSRHT